MCGWCVWYSCSCVCITIGQRSMLAIKVVSHFAFWDRVSLELTSSTQLAGQQATGPFPSPSLQSCCDYRCTLPHLAFYMHAGSLRIQTQVFMWYFMANTAPTESSPQTQYVNFKDVHVVDSWYFWMAGVERGLGKQKIILLLKSKSRTRVQPGTHTARQRQEGGARRPKA